MDLQLGGACCGEVNLTYFSILIKFMQGFSLYDNDGRSVHVAVYNTDFYTVRFWG